MGDFPFPPMSYYYDLGPAAGTHFWRLCSPGDPTSILNFMHQSIAASVWKITTVDATSIDAEKSTTPPSGYCYTLTVVVGGFPGYPNEWSFSMFAPANMCV